MNAQDSTQHGEPPARSTGKRGGFTLIEVVVTLLVVTTGVLALGQLQWGSRSSSTTSFQRTLAQVQALDMGERIWLDLTNPLAGITAWQSAHSESLPGWSGTVEPTDEDDELIRVRIQWQEPGGLTTYDHFVRVPRVEP